MSSNSAAWQNEAKTRPFEVKSAPQWTPGENEILVRNHAVAINPIDGILQALAPYPLKYPAVLGQDVAGEVVAVGPNVTSFKPGARVLGHAVGMATQRIQDCGFQLYTTIPTNMASEIPASVSFEQAVVVPLGLSTASCGLFQEPFLNMQLPTEPAQAQTGKAVLIYGGASSVGSNAIQLAAAAGYKVFATASTKNFEYVKQLGASQVFDSYAPSIKDDLVKAFEGVQVVGALDCIGATGWDVCTNVLARLPSEHTTKFVATTKRGFPEPPEGVSMTNIFGTTIKDNKVGTAVYNEYLPKAMTKGTFVPSPEPMVVGNGLESVQAAVDLYRKGGISAKKVVVSL